MAEPVELRLTLLSRGECPLCDEMKLALEQWDAGRGRVRLEVIDIDGDRQLRRRYGLRVPVLLHDGNEICAGHLSRAALDALGGAPAAAP